MESFTFGSASGTTFAFYFFLSIAVFIGIAIYRLLLEPRLNKWFHPSMSRLQAGMIGASIALMVFLGIYFCALDGFYHLEIAENGQEIRLGYILPKRTLSLQRSMIAEVRRVPAYKGRWQLILYTPAGAEFTSARADYASTRTAWEFMNTQLNSKPRP
jgi:hypothetical protein